MKLHNVDMCHIQASAYIIVNLSLPFIPLATNNFNQVGRI